MKFFLIWLAWLFAGYLLYDFCSLLHLMWQRWRLARLANSIIRDIEAMKKKFDRGNSAPVTTKPMQTTTIKPYQARLPFSNHRIIRPVPPPRPPVPPGVEQMEEEAEKLHRELALKLEQILTQGLWYCEDCERGCERIEDEHGQPAHCNHCGSHRLVWLQAPKGQAGGPAAKYGKEGI